MHLSPLELSRILSDTCSERVSPGYQDELNGHTSVLCQKGILKISGLLQWQKPEELIQRLLFDMVIGIFPQPRRGSTRYG